MQNNEGKGKRRKILQKKTINERQNSPWAIDFIYIYTIILLLWFPNQNQLGSTLEIHMLGSEPLIFIIPWLEVGPRVYIFNNHPMLL